MTTARTRSVRFFVNLARGLGLVFYGLLVKCSAMSDMSHYSSVARFQVTVLGGSISCLVTLIMMVLDLKILAE